MSSEPSILDGAPFIPFVVHTCEGKASANRRSIPVAPPGEDPLAPFEVYDPFGIRNAIVPVFQQLQSDGTMIGMGTAFHVDGANTFLSAYHVIDFVTGGELARPVLFLSMNAVVFGTINVPDECFVPAHQVAGCLVEDDNPMTLLKGKKIQIPAIDIAMIEIDSPGELVHRPETLPVRFRGWEPVLGDYVLAIGFPQLDLSEFDEKNFIALLEEGMVAAYGRITSVHPNGVSVTNPTPVFEVEANWASGMSG